jgi:hypothetical protein
MRKQANESAAEPPWSDWLAALILLVSCGALALTQVLAR